MAAPLSSVRKEPVDRGTQEDLAREVAALRARTQELEAALRARDDFIATLGHELRNPLSPIFLQVGYLTELVKRSEGGVVSAAWLLPKLATFGRRLQRVLDVLNRLMDVAAIGSDHARIELAEMDLVETVREVAAGYEQELAAARCSLTIDGPGILVGRWDRVRVEQIVSNLLSNATRYGAGKPIAIEVAEAEASVVIRVRDQGVGISPEDCARIFERFEQGLGARKQKRHGGFGLGLWVTRKLCLAMDGRITVTSEVGRGSTFTVTLPRRLTETP